MVGIYPDLREIRQDPSITVRKFVTKVWEHPLVTRQTLDHRMRFKPEVHGLMERYGIQRDQYCAMAGGSLTWITTQESDFDAVVITKDQKTADMIAAIPGKDMGEVDIVASDSATRLPHINENWPYNLFLVPDEYIGGDLMFARNLRRELTSRFDYALRNRFEQYMKSLFFYFYKQWHISQWYQNANPLTSKKRQKRFNAALEVRSAETHVPEEWKQAFLNNLQSLHPPDFETYANAMKKSNGELSLLDSAKADPITSVETLKL